MNMEVINIVEIINRKDLKSFVNFPFKLYNKNPYWTPPIIEEEIDILDQSNIENEIKLNRDIQSFFKNKLEPEYNMNPPGPVPAAASIDP